MNLNIHNLGDDEETSGLAQDQALQTKNRRLGSHPVPAPEAPGTLHAFAVPLLLRLPKEDSYHFHRTASD